MVQKGWLLMTSAPRTDTYSGLMEHACSTGLAEYKLTWYFTSLFICTHKAICMIIHSFVFILFLHYSLTHCHLISHYHHHPCMSAMLVIIPHVGSYIYLATQAISKTM